MSNKSLKYKWNDGVSSRLKRGHGVCPSRGRGNPTCGVVFVLPSEEGGAPCLYFWAKRQECGVCSLPLT